MKKILTIIVILMLASSLFASSEILGYMWWHNKIAFAATDHYNIKNNAEGDDAKYINWQYYCMLEEMMFGMWGTPYDSDTFNVQLEWFNYLQISFGDMTSQGEGITQHMSKVYIADKQRFYAILNFGEIYTLKVGAKGGLRMFPFHNSIDEHMGRIEYTKVIMMLENTINIPGILKIDFWFWTHYDFWNPTDPKNLSLGQEDGNILNLVGVFALSGSYSFGLNWLLREEVIIALCLKYYKDNDITQRGHSLVCGKLLNVEETEYYRHVPLFQTDFWLTQELLGIAGIGNMSLTLVLKERLYIHKPWSGGWGEESTLIQTQTVAGLEYSIVGFTFGLFLLLGTQDAYNSSIDYNASGNNDLEYYAQKWVQGTRPHPRGQIGPKVSIGYKKNFFDFTFTYQGLYQFRDYDANRDNFVAVQGKDDGADWTSGIDNGGLFRQVFSWYPWSNMFIIEFGWMW